MNDAVTAICVMVVLIGWRQALTNILFIYLIAALFRNLVVLQLLHCDLQQHVRTFPTL